MTTSNNILTNKMIDIIEAPNPSKIKDNRSVKFFKTTVYSGPLKGQVISALNKSIAEEKIEAANYWAFQLLLSGHANLLFNKLISIAAKQVNIANPKLPLFIYKKTLEWNKIKNNSLYSKNDVIHLRNNQDIRHIIVEMVSLVTLSRKRKLESLCKIKEEDFTSSNIKLKLAAKDSELIDYILKRGDPIEIRIAANEFLYQLTQKNINKSLYWLSWILELEKINIKKYKIFKVAERFNDGINNKFVDNVIWLIWDIINYVKKSDFDIDLECHNQMNALFNNYCMDFTLGSSKRKLIYIIWSIKFLTTPKCDWKLKLIERPYIYFYTLANVNIMINKIKPEEINRQIYNDDTFKYYSEAKYKKINKSSNMINTNTEQQRNLNQAKLYKQYEKEKKARIKEAKKKKITLSSLDKLEQMGKIDKYMLG